MPFTASERDGVLTLTLDTPGSPINIFNHPTAHQLIDIMARVDPKTTRAIVFETAKRNSFINGVGLLLAHASRNFDDVVRASTPPWTAYRAVREAPVPTIAVVQGNCFGCGVEFALNCDYRVATDDGETQFYMTEVNDYLFMPLFGATWNLPEAVGLSAAVDMLLWGERWQSSKALAGGLVDEVVPSAERDERTQAFVQRILAGEQPSRRRGRVAWSAQEDAVVAQTRRRIESLPPGYHQVYTDALNLLETGARQTGTYIDHQQREMRSSGESALSANGKAAYSFFYLRQMASERAAGRLRGGEAPLTLALDVDGDAGFGALAADLRDRRLGGVTLAAGNDADFRFVAPSLAKNARDIAVHVSFAAGPKVAGAAAIYAPAYRGGGRLLELAMPAGESALSKEASARLTRTLQRFGFEVAPTVPSETFVGNRFLFAYLAPLVAFIEGGGDAAVVNASLREAGFVRRPHDLLQSIGNAAMAAHLAAWLGRREAQTTPLLAELERSDYAAAPDDLIVDAMCISLVDAVLIARERGEVRDLPTADLIARELLDFPRHLCSMCSWLKRERVAQALQRDPRVESLVTAPALERARDFVANGREFYR